MIFRPFTKKTLEENFFYNYLIQIQQFMCHILFDSRDIFGGKVMGNVNIQEE